MNKPQPLRDLLAQGIALGRSGRTEEALARFMQVLAVEPDHADALNNCGIALMKLGRSEEALVSYQRVLACSPMRADTLRNCGSALRRLGRHTEALACYAQAQAVAPDDVHAHWNEAICRLLVGDYEAGWKKYEWRWRNPLLNLRVRKFEQALWLGAQDLHGKTILLHGEQGLGDMLQFVRYAPLVAAKGATVLLEVSPKLVPLMGALAGVRGVYARGEPLPATEFHCPLLSLPLAFRTTLDTIPVPIPYLSADPAAVAAWRARLSQDGSFLVGVSWRGNPRYEEDRQRSIPMEVLAPLLSQEGGIRFVSLQKELTAKERRTTGALKQFIHPGEGFGSTANLIGALDLVITVDSSWAHWAGAIGKPLWILLPFTPHWTWLTEREDSPWYPTARLFRQSQIGDWTGAMRSASDALARLRATRKAGR